MIFFVFFVPFVVDPFLYRTWNRRIATLKRRVWDPSLHSHRKTSSSAPLRCGIFTRQWRGESGAGVRSAFAQCHLLRVFNHEKHENHERKKWIFSCFLCLSWLILFFTEPWTGQWPPCEDVSETRLYFPTEKHPPQPLSMTSEMERGKRSWGEVGFRTTPLY